MRILHLIIIRFLVFKQIRMRNAIQWQLLQDPVFNKILLDDLIGTIEQVETPSSEKLPVN